MAEWPQPVFRTTTDDVILIGTMAIYGSQAEASQGIPQQWRAFRLDHPELVSNAKLYGASPCTGDHNIHYLTGVAEEGLETSVDLERLTLVAGEYAFVSVDDPAMLRDTWMWLLSSWLPKSGRKEKNAPEFERYTGISEKGTPIGPVEIWIPVESIAGAELGF